MAAELGAEKLVLPLLDSRASDGNIEANIAEYASLNAIARECGIVLAVENVVCLYGDPLAHLACLNDKYENIAFTYDSKMAQFHGWVSDAFDEKRAWLWRGAVRHVHISDIDAEPMDWSRLRSLRPGEGRIDFDYVFAKLKSVGYDEHITLESTSVSEDGAIQFDKLNRSLDYIHSMC